MRPVPDAMRTSDWPKIPARESPPTQRRRGSDGVGGRTVGSGVGDGSDVGLGATKAAGGGSVLASALSTRAGESNDGAGRGSRPGAWSRGARGGGRVKEEGVADVLEGPPDAEPEVAVFTVWLALAIADERVGVEEGGEEEGDQGDGQHLAGVHGLAGDAGLGFLRRAAFLTGGRRSCGGPKGLVPQFHQGQCRPDCSLTEYTPTRDRCATEKHGCCSPCNARTTPVVNGAGSHFEIGGEDPSA